MSKRYSYELQTKVFKLFLNFLPNGPHKTMFGIFENWNFNEFYQFSLKWDPMGENISKRYSSYKSQPKVFKLLLNFPPNGPHKAMFGIFEILSFRFLTIFFSEISNLPLQPMENLNYLEYEQSQSKTEVILLQIRRSGYQDPQVYKNMGPKVK